MGEILIESVEFSYARIHTFKARMEAVKSTYTAITQPANNVEPTLVFVPTVPNRISNKSIKYALTLGVCLLRNALDGNDREVVSQLFEAGRVNVCVLSSSMC